MAPRRFYNRRTGRKLRAPCDGTRVVSYTALYKPQYLSEPIPRTVRAVGATATHLHPSADSVWDVFFLGGGGRLLLFFFFFHFTRLTLSISIVRLYFLCVCVCVCVTECSEWLLLRDGRLSIRVSKKKKNSPTGPHNSFHESSRTVRGGVGGAV